MELHRIVLIIYFSISSKRCLLSLCMWISLWESLPFGTHKKSGSILFRVYKSQQYPDLSRGSRREFRRTKVCLVSLTYRVEAERSVNSSLRRREQTTTVGEVRSWQRVGGSLRAGARHVYLSSPLSEVLLECPLIFRERDYVEGCLQSLGWKSPLKSPLKPGTLNWCEHEVPVNNLKYVLFTEDASSTIPLSSNLW